jgi:quinoprotein dehydrogenase-associated probable ABC transporter substrate-binding protein
MWLAVGCLGILLSAWPASAQMTGVQKLLAAQTEFRVCAAPDDLPFSNRERQGFDNRIAQLLADAQGKKLSYTWWTAPRGMVSQTLNRWDCDVVMGVPADYELTSNTDPYYCSTYVEVTAASRPAPPLFAGASAERVGVLVSTPPLDLMLRHHVMPRVYLPAQDQGSNAGQIVRDVAAGRLDVGLVWGPVGGFFAARESTALNVTRMPRSTGSARLAFPISIGVRHGDHERLVQLNRLIHTRTDQIKAILRSYGVPLVENSGECIPRRSQNLTAFPEGPAAPMSAATYLRVSDSTHGPSVFDASSPRGGTFFVAAGAPNQSDRPAPAVDPQPTGNSAQNSCNGIKTLADVAKLDGAAESSKPYTVRGGKVDNDTYVGWTRFAVFCERCHGPGGGGSALAPDLAAAVKGLNRRQFETIVRCGVTGNLGSGVMPAWGNNPNIMPYLDKLWDYLRARADGALGPGRPEPLQGN